jgi:glycine hydroxymethyltransferase
LMHVIAGKAVAFQEALEPAFKTYAQQIVKNARALAKTLQDHNVTVTSGGTDCHLILVDLRSLGLTGNDACLTLEKAGITCNKNNVPFDPLPPQQTSGIRLGSPALTTRGMKETEFQRIGELIVQVLKAQATDKEAMVIEEVKTHVRQLCQQFPLYPELTA